MAELDKETGLPLVGASAPATQEEILEFPLNPKVSADLKKATSEWEEANRATVEFGVAFLTFLYNANEAIAMAQKADAERNRTIKRAIASSGIHADQVRGYDVSRGTLRYVKKGK